MKNQEQQHAVLKTRNTTRNTNETIGCKRTDDLLEEREKFENKSSRLRR